MPYPTHLLPTTVVGSYPQPGWLVDRATLHHHGVPRAHAHDMWRVPEALLEQAQDDATILAIRDMERAGIDIVTDGEIRRESYSNRFALALEGVDAETPGELRTQAGRVTKVPRVVGKIRRVAGVETRDALFLRDNATRATKITLPGPVHAFVSSGHTERFLQGQRGRTGDGLCHRGERRIACAQGNRRRRGATGRTLGTHRARQWHLLRRPGGSTDALGGDRGTNRRACLVRLCRRGFRKSPADMDFSRSWGIRWQNRFQSRLRSLDWIWAYCGIWQARRSCWVYWIWGTRRSRPRRSSRPAFGKGYALSPPTNSFRRPIAE